MVKSYLSKLELGSTFSCEVLGTSEDAAEGKNEMIQQVYNVVSLMVTNLD